MIRGIARNYSHCKINNKDLLDPTENVNDSPPLPRVLEFPNPENSSLFLSGTFSTKTCP
jgi:hypothetical protein